MMRKFPLYFFMWVKLVMAMLLAPTMVLHASAMETITFAFWGEPTADVNWRWAELAYNEAFRRLGFNFDYIVCTPTRASYMADRGEIDGEPVRIKAYGLSHPNLVRVEKPIISVQIAAYTKKPGLVLHGWESLRGKNFHVEYHRGILYAQQHLPAVVEPDQLTGISTSRQAFRRLSAGRMDIYVESTIVASEILSLPEFKDTDVYKAGLMMESYAFTYLHNRYKDLAPKLAEALRQIDAEGLTKQYHEQARREFANRNFTKR